MGAEDLTGCLQQCSDGVVIRCVCRPGRPRTRADGLHGDALRMDLAAAPERNAANDELIAWFAKALGVPKSSLALTSGATSRRKSLKIVGATLAQITQRLAAMDSP